MIWHISWSDGTRSVWPVSSWPIATVIKLRHARAIALVEPGTGRWQSIM